MPPTQPRYTLHKPLSPSLFLVRRTGANATEETLLARPLDEPSPSHPVNSTKSAVLALLQPPSTAGTALANLLNHENIVSIRDELVDFPAEVGGGGGGAAGRRRRMFLWDWADAGTLAGVFAEYEKELVTPPASVSSGQIGGRKGVKGGFLPEGFVWHIGLGMVRGLQWLHEGVRERYGVEGGQNGGRCKRVRGRMGPERDWMPVLHRDLKAENVFLQHPRGIETYGAVKLGNFERCWVSGSVSRSKETPVVAMEWEDGPSLGELRDRRERWEREKMGVERAHRPYTEGSELFAVGALLYRMMCGYPLPPAEECPECGCVHLTSNDVAGHTPCEHDCVGDVNIDEVFKPLFNYTDGLKEFVMLLLRLNRSDEWRASIVMDIVWPRYEHWTATTEDGQLHRDIYDDIWFRQQNQERLLKSQHRVGVEERMVSDQDEDMVEIPVDDSVLVV
ncbi:hypothetical protein C8A05DRAFT_34025 [Staphylotrichum tortipilum]|uniref:non-specific serine/threonine protein kinase n=1 Tax=Staphylotrichum tortipilum TaxID=2831512 RepID=A0AAN6MKH7_9PEZI|nr:hypothetical protein C8A05DRAFT_34025 [Staphylotrichum longicolle]